MMTRSEQRAAARATAQQSSRRHKLALASQAKVTLAENEQRRRQQDAYGRDTDDWVANAAAVATQREVDDPATRAAADNLHFPYGNRSRHGPSPSSPRLDPWDERRARDSNSDERDNNSHRLPPRDDPGGDTEVYLARQRALKFADWKRSAFGDEGGPPRLGEQTGRRDAPRKQLKQEMDPAQHPRPLTAPRLQTHQRKLRHTPHSASFDDADRYVRMRVASPPHASPADRASVEPSPTSATSGAANSILREQLHSPSQSHRELLKKRQVTIGYPPPKRSLSPARAAAAAAAASRALQRPRDPPPPPQSAAALAAKQLGMAGGGAVWGALTPRRSLEAAASGGLDGTHSDVRALSPAALSPPRPPRQVVDLLHVPVTSSIKPSDLIFAPPPTTGGPVEGYFGQFVRRTAQLLEDASDADPAIARAAATGHLAAAPLVAARQWERSKEREVMRTFDAAQSNAQEEFAYLEAKRGEAARLSVLPHLVVAADTSISGLRVAEAAARNPEEYWKAVGLAGEKGDRTTVAAVAHALNSVQPQRVLQNGGLWGGRQAAPSPTTEPHAIQLGDRAGPGSASAVGGTLRPTAAHTSEPAIVADDGAAAGLVSDRVGGVRKLLSLALRVRSDAADEGMGVHFGVGDLSGHRLASVVDDVALPSSFRPDSRLVPNAMNDYTYHGPHGSIIDRYLTDLKAQEFH